MKLLNKIVAPLIALAFVSGTAIAQGSSGVKEDSAQLQSDKAALQRQLKRLETDEATLKSDAASGRMSAMSKDAYEVYKAKKAIKGTKKAINEEISPQMKADKAALQRQIRRLEIAEARLKADTEAGKMSAMSKDSEKVYKDKQAIKGEKKNIAADLAK